MGLEGTNAEPGGTSIGPGDYHYGFVDDLFAVCWN